MQERLDPAALARPAVFCRALLQALEASEGRRKRRKRDQTPDQLGQELKRWILERAIADDPEPEEFEQWLLALVLETPGSGGVRAMCQEVLLEYRLAQQDPDFRAWLALGAPSADRPA
ncbi:MAG: type III secretion fhipep protein [Thermomicrobium sp.]|nr:type III secretion fhipep protein [Thermomicrobium sp.]MDW8060354.1 type III secretion fhipep protein [Thermomicrobium sp.]